MHVCCTRERAREHARAFSLSRSLALSLSRSLALLLSHSLALSLSHSLTLSLSHLFCTHNWAREHACPFSLSRSGKWVWESLKKFEGKRESVCSCVSVCLRVSAWCKDCKKKKKKRADEREGWVVWIMCAYTWSDRPFSLSPRTYSTLLWWCSVCVCVWKSSTIIGNVHVWGSVREGGRVRTRLTHTIYTNHINHTHNTRTFSLSPIHTHTHTRTHTRHTKHHTHHPQGRLNRTSNTKRNACEQIITPARKRRPFRGYSTAFNACCTANLLRRWVYVYICYMCIHIYIYIYIHICIYI